MTQITVALVEDDAGARERFTHAIQASPSLCLLFCASTGAEVLQWIENNSPNVLLVDLGLPDMSGIDVIRAVSSRRPICETMVLTLFGDEANMIAAFEAGAKGYLLKDGTEEDLANHIQNLSQGGCPMSPIIARRLLSRFNIATPPKPASLPSKGLEISVALTAREIEVLDLLSRGYTYIELAALLTLKISTIHSHVKNIYQKLEVHSKTEAVYEARHLGLLD